MLKSKKLEEMNNARLKAEKEEESDEDILPFNEQYERMYLFIKKVEEKAAKELIEEEENDENIKNTTPQKQKTVGVNSANKQAVPVNRRKDEFFELLKKAMDKFQIYLQKNQTLLQKINNFGTKKDKENLNEKKSMLMNKIQIRLLLKSNYILL